MNLFKKFRSALSRCLEPKRNKNGSSLAFVVVVGAVLVIWVLCIMPLMNGVGMNGLTMAGTIADYIESRSAIEFCKSELEKIVETDPPYTFCVVRDPSGTFSAVPKKLAAGTNPVYTALINAHLSDDTQDTPMDSSDSVVAICAVTKDSEKSEYYIKVTTFNDGTAGMTYSTVYTIRGTLKINPESYLKSQALPLSDFVLVDGKLGATTIWNSTIHDLSFDTTETNNVTTLGAVTETLLPYLSGKLPGDGYADAGLFLSVFKTTVFPAGGGGNVVITPPAEPDYTDDEWIVPNVVDKDKNNKQPGDIYFKIVSKQYTYRQNNQNKTGTKNTIRIYLQSDSTDITDKCNIYLNGNKFAAYQNKSNHGDNIPTSGIYQVSIDFNGHNTVLAADGLILGEIGEVSNTVGGKRNKPTNLGVSVSGSTATLAENSGAQYGYSTSDDPYNVTWSSNRTFSLQEGKTYLFFAYYPAGTVNGVYQSASDVVYMGYASSLEFVSTLTSGQKYLILGKNNGTYYAMRQSSGSSATLNSQSVNVFFTGNASISNDLLWTVGINNGNQYSFKNNRDYGKYLNMTGSHSNWSGWTISLNLSNNACYFNVNASSGSISKSFSSGWQSTTRYIIYNNGFTQQSSKVSNSNRLYFAKVPAAPTTPDVSRIPVSGSTVTLTTNSMVYGSALSSIVNGNYSKIFANGVEVTSTLNVGKYEITAQVDNNTTIPLGTLTVIKANYSNLSATPSVSVVANPETHEIIASTTFHFNSGAHWIGYKIAGTSDAYKWFPVDDDNTYTFVLPYGNYRFVVRESGTITHNAAESQPVPVELKTPEEIEEEETSTPSVMMGSSLYFMGRNGSIDTEGATIYLYSDLIVLRHDISGDGSVIVHPYNTTDVNTYNIEKYPDPDTLLFAVNDIKDAEGNVVFNALTFYRISSGTDLTDLTTCSNVTVTQNYNGTKTYTWKEGAKYNINSDIDTLKLLLRSGDHPEINMDIAYIDRENNADKTNDDQLSHIVSGETIGWTVDGVLDDTTAKLSTTSKNNSKYVVCAYVSSVENSDIDLMANRVLLAAAETEVKGIKTRKLSVPNSLTFECRYFSIYADLIHQGSSRAELVIENLIRDQSDWDRIFAVLDLTDYSSKSLQIDFELTTTVAHYDNTFDSPINAQIYRIDEERWNVFSEFQPQPLTVSYTNSEIYNLIYNGSNIDNLLDGNFSLGDIVTILRNLSEIANVSVRVVDRYISLDEDGSRTTLTIAAYENCKIEFYTNYIYISKNIDGYSLAKFDLGRWSGDGIADMIINSQERGYASEYLGFFTTNSVETYNGTIVYIAPDDSTLPLGKGNGGITVNGTLIHSGFYYIPACDGGTSITELALLSADPDNAYYYGDNPDDATNVYRINPADLPKYSIYIKPDGTMSDAYVDTGLIGNGDLGESGFSGGNVG